MLFERAAALAVFVSLALSAAPSTAATPPGPLPVRDCLHAGVDGTKAEGPPAIPAFPPVQLAIEVPVEPTPFPSGGFDYLIYELHLQSYTDAPLALQKLDIVDAGPAPGRVVAEFSGARVHERLRAVAADRIDAAHPLQGGKRTVAFVCLAFDAGAVPRQLRHRVWAGDSVAEGPIIGVRRSAPKVLAPPVAGFGWVADHGPGLGSHHRTGLFVAGGRAHLARRFAIDWKRKDARGEAYSGDARDVRSYHSYGEKVFAVADAVVVSARDGIPDNVPRTAAGFSTAVPITMENVAGNAVVLDLGDGQFAYYAHMQPGSVRVKAGDRVERGQWLGRIGNSGDARWPHLHFQVTDGPHILASEGLPFVLERYRTKAADGTWRVRTREYPIGDVAIEFGSGEAHGAEAPE